MEWVGSVTEVDGDIMTAMVTPSDHEGPELVADFSMSQCGITAEPGDLLIITPTSVTKRKLRPWTQAEVDEIMRRARKRARLLKRIAAD